MRDKDKNKGILENKNKGIRDKGILGIKIKISIKNLFFVYCLMIFLKILEKNIKFYKILEKK